MRLGFYPKLAVTGIAKNKKTYVPYILTGIGMVMMFYIVTFLSENNAVGNMRGGESVQGFLSMGIGVIGIFSTMLLFYTNSFLIRRRKKEFGLYNILGMSKGNLSRVIIWESLIIAATSIVLGLGCGVLFSKAAELLVSRILNSTVGFNFTVDKKALVMTLKWFGVIFSLILLSSLYQVYKSKPVELMKSESVGEKPPKANWLLALVGLVLLGGAYCLAITIQDPITAMILFFVAVIMVIAATYLLFIAGSVTFCRLLQKNKRYYYKTNHFISLSSMVYRMKRNGAGLASICILSTMVLVMISSTSCLYIGGEDMLRQRYPRNMVLETNVADKEYTAYFHQVINEELAAHQQREENTIHYRYVSFGGIREGDRIILDESKISASVDFSNYWQLFVIPLEDYNQIMGTSETVAEGEALIYATKTNFKYDEVTLDGIGTFRVKKAEKGFVSNKTDSMQIMPSMFLFVPDVTDILNALNEIVVRTGDKGARGMAYIHDYYGFDLACDEQEQTEIYNRIMERVTAEPIMEATGLSAEEVAEQNVNVSFESMAAYRDDYLSLNSGFFALGLILGLVFICGAVLIMYYKQIIEGYEDQSRFEILQKVGMTKKEIKKSINSQVLTVFFAPLIMSGIHMGFAFPLISKLLTLFGLMNTRLLILVTLGSFGVFALFYILVYLATSRAYYSIVSENNLD